MHDRRIIRFALAALFALQASVALALPPRINFLRRLPAAHDLGQAEDVAIVYAVADNEAIATFLDVFMERANRSGVLRVENAVDPNSDFGSIRKHHPADVYLGVNQFHCVGVEKSSEDSEHDVDGGRQKHKHRFVDAVCEARLDVINAADGRKIASFAVKGEGTSPRSAELTNEERNVAYDQAARYAAITACESITPRVVRESIELDERAPEFDEAFSMIVAERYDDARAIWESQLKREPRSAALHYDLAAVCEAAGDLPAAQRYFEEARRLSPTDTRVRSEFRMFMRRNQLP